MEETAVQALNRLRRQGRLAQLAISGTGFGFDPQSGQSFSLNDTGLFTIYALISGAETSEVAEEMAKEFDVEKTLAEVAVDVFIRQLGRYLK